MFKNLFLYRMGPPKDPSASALPAINAMDELLCGQEFQPTTGTQEKSVGWVAPSLRTNDFLAYHSDGNTILRLRIETRAVPGAVVDRRLKEAMDHIEQTEGRKPGRKERRELRDEVVQSLLPMAFPVQCDVPIWIDRDADLLAVGASSQGKADEAITMLVKTFDHLNISLVNTNTSPAAAMTGWLAGTPDDWPEHFAAGRHVELRSGDESKALVKFDRHHLEDEQMRLHIGQGKLPTKLALSWRDRVSFVLTEGLAIKRIELLDLALADAGEEGGFEADVAIFTGEMRRLLIDLIAALGGEMV